jgi:hypothetical protein
VTAPDPSAILARLTAEVQGHADAGRTPPASLIAVILDLRRQLEVLTRHREAHPLAYARLWAPECRTCPHPDPRAPAPPKARRGLPMLAIPGAGMGHRCHGCGVVEQRTSQIALAQAILDGDYEQVFALGGNRTGKTELGAQVTVAMAQGGDHPDVVAWAALNGLSLARIPAGPGIVWAVSQTFSMSRQIQRGKLDTYLPAGSKRRNWDGESEAEVRLPGGGKIVLKAASMAGGEGNARNPFEGAAIRFAWVDEEIQSPTGYQSIMARTTDQDGAVLNTMTPLSGWTPFLLAQLRHLDKGEPCPPRMHVGFLHAIDNPHVSADVIEGKWANQPEAVRRARLRGEIVALEGAVHPTFSAAAPYVLPAFDPPTKWPRYGGIDFGSRAPFCHLWIAHDESNDVVHVYKEHYEADWTIKDHAEVIARTNACPACYTDQPIGSDAWHAWILRRATSGTGCPTCEGTGFSANNPIITIADPEDRASRNTLTSEYDIPTSAANKDRKRTFDALFTRLALHPKFATPALVIHDCCTNLIREMRRLTWVPGRKLELNTQGDDHAHDVLRYLCGYLPPPRDAGEPAEAE